MKIEIKQF